jgi:hypothetical protein
MRNQKCEMQNDLSLSLFMFFESWANNPNNTFSFDHATIFTNFLNRCSDFHLKFKT